MKTRKRAAFAVVTFGLLTAGCTVRSGGSGNANFGAGLPARAFSLHAPDAASKIQHVVVVIQENRSFDNLFYGYPGADTATHGKNSKGATIKLQPVSLAVPYSISHTSQDFFKACDGAGSIPGTDCRMDGFDLEGAGGQGMGPNPQYGYVPHDESKLYFEMAKQYVLGDHMFTSQIDASFVSHQYIIAGQAKNAVDFPYGPWGCGGGKSDTVTTLNADRTYGRDESPCFNFTTIGDELDAKALPWRFYASATDGYPWLAYQAIKHIKDGPDWKTDVITPPSQFLTDVGNGELAAVTWITPTCANSDHSSCLSKTGPQWVASVVNAVGQSKFWNSTAIFVFWDEWGGWYDHVPAPYADFDGLGFRVPLLVISPYARKRHVSHVQYEQGSILKYIENVFGLAPLASSDARANSLDPDCFDYNRKPRTFVPFGTEMKGADFLRQPLDLRPPDDQ